MTQYNDMEKIRKLSNEDFWEGLRACGGLFARAVRYFKEKHKVEITRQAVFIRAKQNPELLADIEEENKDIAEEILKNILLSEKDKKLQLDAAKFYLLTKAKDRGYTKESEKGETSKIQIEIVTDDKED
jgi:hypothetical protein